MFGQRYERRSVLPDVRIMRRQRAKAWLEAFSGESRVFRNKTFMADRVISGRLESPIPP